MSAIAARADLIASSSLAMSHIMCVHIWSAYFCRDPRVNEHPVAHKLTRARIFPALVGPNCWQGEPHVPKATYWPRAFLLVGMDHHRRSGGSCARLVWFGLYCGKTPIRFHWTKNWTKNCGVRKGTGHTARLGQEGEKCRARTGNMRCRAPAILLFLLVDGPNPRLTRHGIRPWDEAEPWNLVTGTLSGRHPRFSGWV